MGEATTICSDKTGTLTQNRMNVVRSFAAGAIHDDTTQFRNLPLPMRVAIAENAAVNSHPRTDYQPGIMSMYPVQLGNKTECAVLQFADAIVDKTYRQYRTDVETVTVRPDGGKRVGEGGGEARGGIWNYANTSRFLPQVMWGGRASC